MTEYDKMTKEELIEELEKMERLFSSAYELVSSSDDAVIGQSLDGTIVSWNRGAENIYGYSAGEIIGRNVTVLSPPDRHDEVLRILERIRQGNRIKHYETVRVTKDGRQIHVSLNISPIINEAGEIIGASSIARDVSERKRLGEELLLAKFCIDKASISICRAGPDAKILDANDYMCRSLGYTREELTSMSIFDIDPTFTQETWLEHREKLRVSGTRTFESLHRRKDGTTFPVEVTANYLKFGSKGVGISFARDITEYKRAEKELQESNALLRAIIEAAPTAIIGLDLDGNVQTVWNPAAEKMLGFSAREVMGHPLPCVPAETQEEFRRFRERMRSGETLVGEEVRRQKSDGTPIDYSIYASPLRDAEGRVTGNIAVLVDITERKRMEEELRLAREELEKRVVERTEQLERTAEELRKSEERYALAVQGSYDGIWDLNLETGEVYNSPRCRSILGFEDNEIADNLNIWESRLHPDDYTRVMDTYYDYLEGRIPLFEIEHRLRHKDGSYRWVLSRGACLRDPHGKPYRMAGSLSDVTEKKRAEDALKQSEKNFRQVVEHSPVAIAIYSNKEQIFILVNRKFTELFGYTLDDIPDVGRWWPLAYPDEKYRKVVKAVWESKVKQAIKKKRPFEPMEAMVTCKDGSVRYIEFNFSWVGERNLVSLIDLTEIKRAHEVIGQSEKKYRRLFEESKDTIFISDLSRRIVDVNQAGIDLYGYSKEELSSLDLEKLYGNPADREILWQNLYRYGFVSDLEVEMKKKNGEKIIVHLSMSVIKDDKGHISGYQGIIRDVTERKKLERQLLQSQKMESVGILAGGVAHDFNNLLTAISGYGQILLENIPEDNDLSQESIRNVLDAADRAAELTRGLLAFSRKQLISPKLVQIDTLISNTGKLIGRIIGEDIDLRTNFSERKLLVKADPGQIEQVLMNLATNARDAMPHGGHLSISTRQVVVEEGSETLFDLPSPGEYAMLSVADTGTGIDRKTLESIFEPFYTTKEVGKGTGLGLAIVHGIIKQHNGSVLARSEPGKGTTFDIYLPLVKGHAIKDESKISSPLVKGTETLLVAEDDETVRMIMRKILTKAGYKVIIADDGEDAVKRFREHDNISLVLSDLVMPKKSGKEVQDEIRKMKPGTKVIFISGYAADVMEKKGIFEEGTEFIMKPFKKEDLLAKVREVLDRD